LARLQGKPVSTSTEGAEASAREAASRWPRCCRGSVPLQETSVEMSCCRVEQREERRGWERGGMKGAEDVKVRGRNQTKAHRAAKHTSLPQSHWHRDGSRSLEISGESATTPVVVPHLISDQIRSGWHAGGHVSKEPSA
jgi:hypothetical protein